VAIEEEKMRKIKEIILQHKGRANAIKSKSIASAIGISEDDTHIGTRNLITKLVKQGLPIGACDNGYFLIETQKEVDEYGQLLNSRIQEIYDRLGRLQFNFDMYYRKAKKRKPRRKAGEDEDEDIL
jgi:hypothetical protein